MAFILISENFQQSVIVPPECVNSTRWKKSFSFFAGMVWKTLQSHSGCLKNVLADNCANLGSKQVYKKTAHGAHLALFLSPRRHARVFFFSFPFFTHTRWGNLAPEEASQSQSPWDEPAVIARHYIMMVSHSLGFRDSRTNAQIHYGLNSLWQLSQGKPCEKVDFWLWEKHNNINITCACVHIRCIRYMPFIAKEENNPQVGLRAGTVKSRRATFAVPRHRRKRYGVYIRYDIKLTVCMRQHKTPTLPEGLDASLNISGDHRKQSTSPEAKLQVGELCVRFQINTSKCFL